MRIGEMKEKYKIGFDVWGIVVFLLIMIPNFIWFGIPAPYDILRDASVTPVIDGIASVFQVVMVMALCILINKDCKKPMPKKYVAGIIVLIALYFAGWGFYYNSVTLEIVMLDLCIAPCLAFLLFSVARKNIVAFISGTLFMICHVIYCLKNLI